LHSSDGVVKLFICFVVRPAGRALGGHFLFNYDVR